MTAKEKAKELYNKMIVDFTIDKWQSKQCALVAVDEIIKSNPTSELSNPFLGNRTYENVNYWKDVKKEIESL
jgi:hypothetical protein